MRGEARAFVAGAALLAAFAARAASSQPRPVTTPSTPAASASASASASPSAAAAPTAKPGPAPRPQGAAIASVASAIVEGLRGVEGRLFVAAPPLVSDAQAPRAAALVAALANQIAGRRGSGARARAEPVALAAARTLVRGETALAFVSIEIAGGELRATADVYPVPRNVWARARDPEPGAIAHAFAHAPIDAEVRSFLAPVPLVQAHVDRARNFESDVVALACGDLDGDGALEIVSVSRRRVTTLRLRGGRVFPINSRSWPDLAPVAPAPLREPIAFATIAPHREGARLDIALTDRASSVRLDGALRVDSKLAGLALPDGDATSCTRWAGLVVTGPFAPCAPTDASPYAASVGGRYDAFASARLVSPRGEPFVVWAGREGDKLEIRDEHGKKEIFDEVGAQLAVGDLDQDGDAEIISTVDTQNSFADAVVVRSWSRAAPTKLRDVMRIPAAAGVHAVAVCPPDGPGRAPFVVATADEIWVVR